MPGIGSLDWPAKDLQAAVINYVQQRGTFASAGTAPADFILNIRAWLTMRSRWNYLYKLRLESDLGPSGKAPVKTYVVEKETVGSAVRWVTASDRIPIQQALQAALDDLLQQIEQDAALYRR
ncbi:MAG TPA: hypothetical protein VJ746_20385 [Nitrospira sp.]|nr:hypothetical protein [Nitrospira sp.]